MASTSKWIASATALSIAALGSTSVLAQTKGPSSSAEPYVLPLVPGVSTTSLLTVGDSVNLKSDGTPYRMVGIPDGMGAFDNGDGTFTVLMNHEIGRNRTTGVVQGAVRDHGAANAFVSKYTIRKNDLTVLRGEDLIQVVATWNPATSTYNPLSKGVIFDRFCSADLPEQSAFFSNGVGYRGRLFMNGEESGAEGRAFAHNLDGFTYELPRLGKFSWENSLANPATGLKTVVVGTDDTGPGQVYVYIGTKTNSGTPVDRAGLTNGLLYGVKVAGVPLEPRTPAIAPNTRFSLAPLGNVENQTGAQLQTASTAAGVTEFLRPEDGHWDPKNPSHFYFVTTDRFDTIKNPGTPVNQVGRSRLYRLRFDDINDMTKGGVIDTLLDGTEPFQMLDNMTVTAQGEALIQEDPGGQDYLAKIQRYNIASDTVQAIAEHNPKFFAPGAPNFLTRDEESSGIIDVSDILGRGSFIINVQAHYGLDAELVEGGQLLVMRNPPPNEAPVAVADSFDATEDTPLSIAAPGVLANDTDADANALTATLVTNAANGNVVLNADGSFVYTPNANFVGLDTFTYSARDAGTTASNVVTVTLRVSESSDAPTNNVPLAQTVVEDKILIFVSTSQNAISISDPDGDDEIATVDLRATNGKLFLQNGEEGLNVIVGGGQGQGNQSTRIVFTGKISDINKALINLAFLPNRDFTGQARLTITTSAQDTGTTPDTDSVIINVTPVNDAPLAATDTLFTTNNSSRVINVLANDRDPDGDVLRITGVANPARGTAVIVNNAIRYTADANSAGLDVFTYTVSDGKGGTATGFVRVSTQDVLRPTVSIQTPANGAQVSNLSTITGRFTDQGTGVRFVYVTITSLSRNQSFTGSGFGARGTLRLAAINRAAGTFSISGPNASQLGTGNFLIEAFSIDAAGNRSFVTRSVVSRASAPTR
jgi:VCBS repeat-containing protein